MLSRLLDWIFLLIYRYGRPVRTRGKETEDVLKLKKFYEEQAANGHSQDKGTGSANH